MKRPPRRTTRGRWPLWLGSVALLLQKRPSLRPDDVKCLLVRSARPAVDPSGELAYSIFQQGAGMLDVYGASRQALPGGSCANRGLDIALDLAGTQHYGGAVARIALYEHDRPVATMLPEKRMYWLEQQPASIPAVWSSLNEDLYVILTAIEADGAATLKIRRNPLVSWVWLGGFTFVLGTALVMWPHPERGRTPGA